MVMIVDPPAPSTGTTLVFNMDSLASSVLYLAGGTVSSPVFKFETVRDNHIRLRAGGVGGAVVGEIIYCGTFEEGLGTVTFGGGRRDLKIEDWVTVTDRWMMVPIGEIYVWNEVVQKSPNGNVVTGLFYEAKVDDKVKVIYTPSWMGAHTSCSAGQPIAPGSSYPLTRAHIHFAPEVDKKVYAQLLLSISLFNTAVLKNAKPSAGDFMTAAGALGAGMGVRIA